MTPLGRDARTNAAIYYALLVLALLAAANALPVQASPGGGGHLPGRRQWDQADVRRALAEVPTITSSSCSRSLQCRWGSKRARRLALAELEAAEECPGEMTSKARYAARVLETQQMRLIPHCPDWELERAFALTNATLGCAQTSGAPMHTMCDTAHFLTPGMHAVTLALVVLGAAQTAVAYV